MDPVWKLFGAGVASAILCATVRSREQTYALGVALAAITLLAAVGLQFLQPVLRSLNVLRDQARIEAAVFSPILRVCGIGLVTDLCCAYCNETGERSIGRILEFGGSVASLCALLPLLDGVLELLRPYLGG